MNATIIIVILVVYMAGMMAIGWYGKRYATNMSDFLTAAKKGKLHMVAGSYLGAHVGTGILIGGATNGAKYGIGGAWYGIGAALSFVLFGVFIARWAYKNNYLTFPAFLRERYKDTGKIMTVVWSLLGAGVAITTLTGQILAGRFLFTYIGVDPIIGSIISMLIIYLYCQAAGMWGVMQTDWIQCVVIIVGLIISIISVFTKYNGAAQIATLDPSYFKAVPFNTKTLLLMVLPTAVYGLTGGASMQRTASSESKKVAFLAPLIGAALVALFTFLPVVLGMFGIAENPAADPSSIIYEVIATYCPPLIAGLMFAAIVAAVMSTCDTTIMTIITSLVYDAYANVVASKWNLKTDEKFLKRVSGYVTIAMCIISLLLAFKFNSIISVLSSGYSMWVCGGMIPAIGGILWKKGTGWGALASTIAGMIGAFILMKGWIDLPTSLFALIPAIIAYVVVSLLTQKQAKEAEEKYAGETDKFVIHAGEAASDK